MHQRQWKVSKTPVRCDGAEDRKFPIKQSHSSIAALLLCLLIGACKGLAPTPEINLPVAVTPADDAKTLAAGAVPSNGINHDSMGAKSIREIPQNVAPDGQTEAEALKWQDQIHTQFNYARQLVEAELSTDLGDIQLMLVNDEPINREVSIETHRLVRNQFNSTDFADNFLAQVMKSQAGTYAALYSARLKAVMVSRNMLRSFERSLPPDPTVRQSALLTLLIHELVHAADDKRYNIHENRALSFRASFAQSATFEGHAQWITRAICEKSHCLPGLDALDNFMFSRNKSSNQFTQPVEAISRNVLEYSYVEGERFIGELGKRKNGRQLIDSTLASPPHDPVQILTPETYPDTARDERNNRLITASKQIEHPWVTQPWVGVETSPLKGINLRADPDRRRAAVDGFTRLIQAMVAMQFYNQESFDRPPMEVTVLQAESAHTARLFASTLHNNTHQADASVNEEPLKISTGAQTHESLLDMHLYRTTLSGDNLPYRTTIGVSGLYVVQIAGNASDEKMLEDYAIRVLLNLQLGQT
jgi:hypothetical protein